MSIGSLHGTPGGTALGKSVRQSNPCRPLPATRVSGGLQAPLFLRPTEVLLQRLDGRLGNATRPVADALARLDAILDCCQGPACAPPGTPASCRLSDMPTAWAETAPSKRIKFTGPLDAGGTAAHTLLLEYVEGKPPRQVGWGRATEADIERLSGIHAREFRFPFRRIPADVAPALAQFRERPVEH